jgi:peptidoglycan/LPS O-acetylase OafA/YrhL
MAITAEDTTVAGDEAGTPPGDRSFRPDVQGLRAVAVVLVVLFHANIPGLRGGYVGVDVFYVISGFVITGVLLRERARAGSTSLLHFYTRRIRRILPAASLVIIASVIASYAFLGSVSGNQNATDARWASVFLINIHFAATGTNYLASLMPPSVLQNYWSLAVEEQFYLVYPAIFLVVGAVSLRSSLRRRIGWVLAAAVVASFVWSIVQTSNNPTAAFFSPLPRVWELALGGLVAVSTGRLRRLPAAIASASSWVGLGAILLASVVFSAATPYPGWRVALPVCGAALVIAGGTANPTHGVERLLSLRAFQWVGLISFSLYLWHWPVLQIATQRRGVAALPTWDNVLLILGSVVLAALTYRFVENPVRHSGFLAARRWASLILGVCLVAATLTVATVELDQHPGGALANNGLTGAVMGDACPSPKPQEVKTLMGAGPRTSHRTVARVMVVGDSTACTMLPGLEAVAAPAGVQIENAAVIGCGVVSGEIAPQITNGVNENALSAKCSSEASAQYNQALRSGKPSVILWGSSWEREGLVVGQGAHRRVLQQGSPQWYSVLTQRMSERLKAFTSTGATVVMLSQAPFVPVGAHPKDSTSSDKDFARLNALMTDVASHTANVKVVDLANRICPSGPPCALVVDSVWVRGDGAHYTDEGSLWVARWLLPKIGVPALQTQNNALPVMNVVTGAHGKPLKGTELVAGYSAFHDIIARVTFQITDSAHKTTVIGSGTYGGNLWIMHWNTKLVPNGTYVLRSVAYNSAGNRSISKGITIKVAN